jgi:hypothetical protein
MKDGTTAGKNVFTTCLRAVGIGAAVGGACVRAAACGFFSAFRFGGQYPAGHAACAGFCGCCGRSLSCGGCRSGCFRAERPCLRRILRLIAFSAVPCCGYCLRERECGFGSGVKAWSDDDCRRNRRPFSGEQKIKAKIVFDLMHRTCYNINVSNFLIFETEVSRI